jgi:predicted nuclease of predicted toxin-antitoxin system
VKLLLDENISRRIVFALLEKFPNSSHVEFVGLAGSTDSEICEYAASHGFVIITKDEDFDRLVAIRGYSPKLVKLSLGNSTNDEVARAILGLADQIISELQKPEIGIVEIG